MSLGQFLVEDYRSDAWYWELVEMWRKLVVGGLLMFVRRGSLLQLLLAIVLELCFLAAVAWCARPLADEVLVRFSHRVALCLQGAAVHGSAGKPVQDRDGARAAADAGDMRAAESRPAGTGDPSPYRPGLALSCRLSFAHLSSELDGSERC